MIMKKIQMQEIIEVNSRVAQNQDEYQKKYEKLVSEYELLKSGDKRLELEISSKLINVETINLFISTIKKGFIAN